MAEAAGGGLFREGFLEEKDDGKPAILSRLFFVAFK